MASADDARWRQYADVVVHRETSAEPLLAAAATLRRLPGCAVVAVPIRPAGFVLVVRGRPPVIVVGPSEVEACAAVVYSTLLSLARAETALGSSTWP